MDIKRPILTVKRLPKGATHPQTWDDIGMHWMLSLNGEPLLTDSDHSVIFQAIFEIEYDYQQKVFAISKAIN